MRQEGCKKSRTTSAGSINLCPCRLSLMNVTKYVRILFYRTQLYKQIYSGDVYKISNHRPAGKNDYKPQLDRIKINSTSTVYSKIASVHMYIYCKLAGWTIVAIAGTHREGMIEKHICEFLTRYSKYSFSLK